ncbi:MAG: hypothetical protein P8Z80_20160 [Pseudolabrys sp.]
MADFEQHQFFAARCLNAGGHPSGLQIQCMKCRDNVGLPIIVAVADGTLQRLALDQNAYFGCIPHFFN